MKVALLIWLSCCLCFCTNPKVITQDNLEHKSDSDIAPWADELIVNYLEHNTEKLNEIDNYPITYIKSTDNYKGRKLILVKIGRNFEHRFLTQQMVYIDSISRKIFEYNPHTDSITAWLSDSQLKPKTYDVEKRKDSLRYSRFIVRPWIKDSVFMYKEAIYSLETSALLLNRKPSTYYKIHRDNNVSDFSYTFSGTSLFMFGLEYKIVDTMKIELASSSLIFYKYNSDSVIKYVEDSYILRNEQVGITAVYCLDGTLTTLENLNKQHPNFDRISIHNFIRDWEWNHAPIPTPNPKK